MINGVPRILIIRLSAIGDVARVLPALHNLREAHPNAQIDWVVERKSAAILEDHPALDQLLVFDRPQDFWRALREFRGLCRRVRQGYYDVVLDFHGIVKSGALAWSSRAPERHGFAWPRGRELSWLCANRRVKLPRKDMNRINENLLLAENAGAGTKIDAAIFVPDEVRDVIDAYFEESFDGGKHIVAMHAPVDRPEKQWPLAHFAALADYLLSDGRFEVVLTWGPGQRRVAQTVADLAQRNPHIAPETESLMYYAGIAQRSDLYFGGDTGPMHIAALVNTPVVAVFGGTNPAQHAPLHTPSEVLYTPPDGRASAADRLRAITPEQAYDACLRVALGMP